MHIKAPTAPAPAAKGYVAVTVSKDFSLWVSIEVARGEKRDGTEKFTRIFTSAE
jgi:hypothetical protein